MSSKEPKPLPVMERYSRHVLVCTGGFCSESRSGRATYSRLASLLQREGLLFGPTRVKRSEAPCLGVCGGGPIVAVYPEGVCETPNRCGVAEQALDECPRSAAPTDGR